MGVNPWSGVMRWQDYEVLARVFGFPNAAEAKHFFEGQHVKHERRVIASDRRRA